MDNSRDAVTPFKFVNLLRQAFPEPFAQRTATNYKQQDADEFYSTVMQKILSQELQKPTPRACSSCVGGGLTSASPSS